MRIHFFWILTLVIFIYGGCEDLGEESIRLNCEDSVLVGFLQQEYDFRYLYEPPCLAFVVKNVASHYYEFWDGKHKLPNSDAICDTCAGWALNTGDELYSGMALLDWDRHSESYTTHLGTYANQVVYELRTAGWDTLNWAWPPRISSAWRNPARNDMIPGASDTSLHMFGRAIDFDGSNATQLQLLYQGVRNVGGEPEYENYPTGWIHSEWPPY